MSGTVAHARTHESDRLCLEWAETFDPGDGKGPLGPPDRWDEVTKDVVLEAFRAGMMVEGSTTRKQMACLARGVALMAEGAALFRSYEAHHRAKAIGNVHADDRARKAGVNGDIAARFEAFLLDDTTPKDRIAGLALSLVQDLGDLIENSGGVYGLHQNGDPSSPWSELTEGGRFEDWLSSYDRLKRLLDEGAKRPDRIVIDDPHAGDEVVDALRQSYFATAEIVPGSIKLDGNPIDALEGVAVQFAKDFGLTVDHDSFAEARAYAEEPVHCGTLTPRETVASDLMLGNLRTEGVYTIRPEGRIVDVMLPPTGMWDPSHDSGEFPRPPVVIIEATIDGKFPGDEGYRRAEAARISSTD